MPKDLPAWLNYIESLHPQNIAMGLDRVKRMIERMQLTPSFTIVTVAGTNGKGSTCAMLTQIYQQAGYRTGTYSSPHLLRYNERVRLNGKEASDNDLCEAFAAVDNARHQGDVIALTYFEVGTLAAMWYFMQAKLDIAILEVGLGGRLDAVNAFEPHCAIVTSVDLDHQEYLGNTREEIGFEKAGVYRANKPAICGEINPPLSLVAHAKNIQAQFQCLMRDFTYHDLSTQWQYCTLGKVVYTLSKPALQGDYQLSNAACAIAAVETLQSCLPVKINAIEQAMLQVNLAGRFQTIQYQAAQHQLKVIFDVAHNPHASTALAGNLKSHRQPNAKTYAVFAMLADKDMNGVVSAVKEEIDVWYIASIDHARGANATDLAVNMAKLCPKAVVYSFNNAVQAFRQACIDIEACKDANENDKIIVFGSFFTVSAVMQAIA
ncbi:MAG: bifunctional tetrahydrofolate synthase/dihydrofolate synthase [Methylophilaceae bacterium]